MRFAGKVGYVIAEETSPDVFVEQITEKLYYGDVLKNTRQWENGESINSNINVTNSISIVADDFAYQHIGEIRYVWYLKQKWSVKTITIDRPRITLTLGGLYHGGQTN